ncbi:MAG: FAA hydrolase family protein [Acidobacteria bacterium]|nr:FAA hydrolase family protein [Acidobacteriota bacterium]
MRFATFSLPNDSHPRLGVVSATHIAELRAVLGPLWKGKGPVPGSMLELIDGGPTMWTPLFAAVSESLAGLGNNSEAKLIDSVRLHAPIPRPRKNVMCLGLNYLSHLEESARARGREAKIPEVPVIFTKSPTAVNGPYDPIHWDTAATQQVDYEVELGVVIGTAGKNIARAHALDHIFGYTVINDVSARDLQLRHMQWFKGKSLDGFCPMGPVLVTRDEFGDPQNKAISLDVNGVEKQNSNTSRMIFPVDVIIEQLSKGMTLEPGDVISTGTPEGVGLGRTPPEYLNDGDVVVARVEGIGALKNRVTVIR